MMYIRAFVHSRVTNTRIIACNHSTIAAHQPRSYLSPELYVLILLVTPSLPNKKIGFIMKGSKLTNPRMYFSRQKDKMLLVNEPMRTEPI